MNFEKYQVEAQKTAIYTNKIKEVYPNLPDKIYGLLGLSYVTMGFAGEAGELANKVKKIIRDSGGEISVEVHKDLSKEIGDCLWYIANIANELQMNLDIIAQENLSKLFSRKERNVLTGSGDNR